MCDLMHELFTQLFFGCSSSHYSQDATTDSPTFPQIDVIGAMAIVRQEGKLSGLFCAVLCATIVHSELHTHMNRPNSSLDWVLSHWAHFIVLGFIFVHVLFCVCILHACVVL